MSELKEKIEQCKRGINHAKASLEEYQKKLDKYQNQKEVSYKDLYNGIENYFDLNIQKNKSYTFILGGDGRSQPWDETRKGTVANVKLKEGYFFTDEQIKLIKEYVKKTNDIDYIKLIK